MTPEYQKVADKKQIFDHKFNSAPPIIKFEQTKRKMSYKNKRANLILEKKAKNNRFSWILH